MNLIISIILLSLSALVNAVTCTEYKPPKNEEIVFNLDAGVTHFSVPTTLDGHHLRSVTLWAYSSVKGLSGELAAPLAFNISEGYATGHFAVTSNFLEAEVTASYSNEVCGPRLKADVSI